MTILIVSACGSQKIEQIGYFKGANNNRVFMLRAAQNISSEQISAGVEALPHTTGRMTVAFVFEFDVQELSDLITLQSDFMAANGAILDKAPDWRWWYRQAPNGEKTLIDCKSTPGDSICRNK